MAEKEKNHFYTGQEQKNISQEKERKKEDIRTKTDI